MIMIQRVRKSIGKVCLLFFSVISLASFLLDGIYILTLLLLTPDISGATYLACVTNTGYIRSLGTLALSKIKTT